MMTQKIPAIPYMTRVRQYAEASGLKFFTWSEQTIAIAKYESTIQKAVNNN